MEGIDLPAESHARTLACVPLPPSWLRLKWLFRREVGVTPRLSWGPGVTSPALRASGGPLASSFSGLSLGLLFFLGGGRIVACLLKASVLQT